MYTKLLKADKNNFKLQLCAVYVFSKPYISQIHYEYMLTQVRNTVLITFSFNLRIMLHMRM